ncbi:MAG TPA: adenylate/guanylate cyclase domain-containing protein [Mycobacteriales bacterium]|nr:adenylate/guanylate cyclase domain-containing protein [Mycobacteriales bacterium]
MDRPETRYADAGGVSIAYQVFGQGDVDVVIVGGFATHLDLDWESPLWVRFTAGLATFARVLHFDKRGTGLSDRIDDLPTIEERIDDVRAVMDAAGSERAVLLGISEGAAMSLVFAATHPDRTAGLVLYGGMARATWAPDYPWAAPAEAIIESARELVAPHVYTGEDLEIWMPTYADDPVAQEYAGRYRRAAASPAAMQKLFLMFLDVDVRHVLPIVRVPTLVIHRYGDRVVNRRAGQWMAEQIAGAKYVELPGRDHFPWTADSAAVVAEIREFLTGDRGPAPVADRVLATVLFTDIVGSTERAAALGDAAWRDVLETYQRVVRREVDRHRGREVKSMGDGSLATFDGPGRAVRCAQAIRTEAARLGLEVRSGLHCGEVEVMGDDVGGIAVHVAARIAAVAGPGDVLVSSTVKDLVAGSDIEFADRGTPELRGIDRPWQCFAAG